MKPLLTPEKIASAMDIYGSVLVEIGWDANGSPIVEYFEEIVPHHNED